jgi:hypothetical protein
MEVKSSSNAFLCWKYNADKYFDLNLEMVPFLDLICVILMRIIFAIRFKMNKICPVGSYIPKSEVMMVTD